MSNQEQAPADPRPKLTPRLVCAGADKAIKFYETVFKAELLERFASPNGMVVHAALRLNGSVVAVIDEHREFHNHAPPSLGGSAVILHLDVDDPDEIAERAVKHGAEMVFPIADQFYGRREGRFADPFGHLWIVGKPIATPTNDEIQKGVDSFGG